MRIEFKTMSTRTRRNIRRDQNTLNGLNFVLSAFLQCTCLLNAGQERSTSNLVFEQFGLRNNLIFGVFHSTGHKKSEKLPVRSKFRCVDRSSIVAERPKPTFVEFNVPAI